MTTMTTKCPKNQFGEILEMKSENQNENPYIRFGGHILVILVILK
jgi:hypothetical protein